jgi:hypothetical protein
VFIIASSLFWLYISHVLLLLIVIVVQNALNELFCTIQNNTVLSRKKIPYVVHMESICKKLCNIPTYEDMQIAILLPEMINEAGRILDDLKLSHTTHSKDFLCAFIIYKFPNSVLGDTDIGENSDILDYATRIVTPPHSNKDVLRLSIVNFIYHFKKWKTDDRKIIIYHLFEEYHQLSVDILNTNDREKQLIMRKCQTELLDTAKLVGGSELVEEIIGYKAVIASNANFQNEYDKAYWVTLKESYDSSDYVKCIEIITFINNVLVSFGPNTDAIENASSIMISYLENNNCGFLNIKTWALTIFDYIKTVHSPKHDMELESFKRDIHIKEIYLPTVIKNVFGMIKHIIHDFEEIRRKINNP